MFNYHYNCTINFKRYYQDTRNTHVKFLFCMVIDDDFSKCVNIEYEYKDYYDDRGNYSDSD